MERKEKGRQSAESPREIASRRLSRIGTCGRVHRASDQNEERSLPAAGGPRFVRDEGAFVFPKRGAYLCRYEMPDLCTRCARRSSKNLRRKFHYAATTTLIPTQHSAPCSLTVFASAPTLNQHLSEDPLRLIGRYCLVVVLVIGMVDLPGFAANEKPLGLVLQAQEAHMDNAKLAVGTTVYPGDTVETDTGGTLRLKLGTN